MFKTKGARKQEKNPFQEGNKKAFQIKGAGKHKDIVKEYIQVDRLQLL